MIFVDWSDNSFVITEFEYFSTVFVYDLSVLPCYFVFVNDCEFSNCFFYYFTHGIMIENATVFMVECKALNC